MLKHFIQIFSLTCVASTCLWVFLTTGFHTELRRWRSYEWGTDRTTDIAENQGCTEVFSLCE